ncbi:MAG: ATP-binding protein [Spirochaetaceae bacterium]|nr:ATP-binding protein [Spirochaetaceae bacterium]
MYLDRAIEAVFRRALSLFPAVLITGPRQSGKTTFLKETLKDQYRYISFDDPLNREYAFHDPKGFLEQFSQSRVILDEIQYVPELLSYIKIAIDSNRRESGKWVLTGSQQFNMMRGVTESLAGRIAVLNLLPFHSLEHNQYPDSPITDFIWRGGYPENVLFPDGRDLWISSYISTYLERDVRQLQGVHNLSLFQTFLFSCASRHSQELSYASLSKQVGISQPAAKDWISVLTASGITFLLRPYHSNFGKRLIKSPKLYFLDSALPAFLTRQPSPEALFNGTMGGSFFEGFIISETHKILIAGTNKSDIHFWRSHDQLEVDLILELNGIIHPVEIIKTGTPTLKHAEPLRRFKSIVKSKAPCGEGFVVCTVREALPLGSDITAIPWRQFMEWVVLHISAAPPK